MYVGKFERSLKSIQIINKLGTTNICKTDIEYLSATVRKNSHTNIMTVLDKVLMILLTP